MKKHALVKSVPVIMLLVALYVSMYFLGKHLGHLLNKLL
jgi:hypothetical protein